MTRGLTLAYLAWVRKFNTSRPMASAATRTTAIRRYVFMTTAEPYASTNCRFAFSIVLGFRSATTGSITGLPERVEMQQTGDGPDHADRKSNHRGDAIRGEDEPHETGASDVLFLTFV